MSRLTRLEEQAIEDRVLEYVQGSIGPLALVDSRTVAVACRLHWQVAKTKLLELSLLGKIEGQRLSGKWLFARKRSA